MQIKIVRGLAIAMALGLTACSGSDSTSTSSAGSTGATGTPTTTSAGTHSTSTGGTTSTSNSTSTGGTTSNSSSTGSHSSSASSTVTGSTGSTGSTTPTTSGSTGTGSHSSSTGGSGSHSSSGSGSTGTTSGQGTTDADCGFGHATCADGTHCNPYPTQANTGLPTTYACACDSGNTATHAPDTCREANDLPGGNGLVVCDDSTGNCRAPKDYEEVFENAASTATLCAPNYTYVHFAVRRPDGGQSGEALPDGGTVADYPDGGNDFACLGVCDHTDLANHGCQANWTACLTGALSGTRPDGGQESIDACVENDCGVVEHTNPADGGILLVDAGSFNGACTTDRGAGTGFCSPLPSSNGGYIGVCFATGTATAASQAGCNGLFGFVNSTLNCGPSLLCLSTGIPNVTFTTANGSFLYPSGVCAQTCNFADNNFTCDAIPGVSTVPTCRPFPSDPSPAENPDQYGTCQ